MSEYKRPCKFGCGAMISMQQDASGKWRALDPDSGLPHWQTCKAWAEELERREKAEKEERRKAWLADHPEVGEQAKARGRQRGEAHELETAFVRAVREPDGFEDDLPW